MIKMKSHNDVRERIKALGGQSERGRRLGYTRQRVHRWIQNGIPARIKAERPDLFGSDTVPEIPHCSECGRVL